MHTHRDSMIERTAARVETAQATLDTALAEGRDTTSERQSLKLAQQELARVQAEARRVAQEAAHTDAERLAAEAAKIVEEARRGIEAELATLARLDMPTVLVPQDIAAGLLRAREAHAVAREAHEVHRTQVERLRSRQSDLQAQRTGIIQRRAAGKGDDEADAGRLALVDADLEGLAQVIEKTMASAPPDPDEALQAVRHHESILAAAVRDTLAEALRSLTLQLERRLLETAARLAEAEGRTGGNVGRRWRPSMQLAAICQHGVA